MSVSPKINVAHRQLANAVLMVEPTGIRFNSQTAKDNHFQRELAGIAVAEMRVRAQHEFSRLVSELRDAGIQVLVATAPENCDAPDAVFPNNWITFHEDGTVVLYPMMAENRRTERRHDIIELVRMNGYTVEKVVDFSAWESNATFLEGTGSLVLDRIHRLAFASLSERTHEVAVHRWCARMQFKPVVFCARQSIQNDRKSIYHTTS